MTEKEFNTWIKEAFEELRRQLPYLHLDYGVDFNRKKSRYEVTYFCENDKKQGYGGCYVKSDQLKNDAYMADVKAKFVPNMLKNCREHFGLIVSA